jgi:uncharacterized protein YdgA (DUF945 family)
MNKLLVLVTVSAIALSAIAGTSAWYFMTPVEHS